MCWPHVPAASDAGADGLGDGSVPTPGTPGPAGAVPGSGYHETGSRPAGPNSSGPGSGYHAAGSRPAGPNSSGPDASGPDDDPGSGYHAAGSRPDGPWSQSQESPDGPAGSSVPVPGEPPSDATDGAGPGAQVASAPSRGTSERSASGIVSADDHHAPVDSPGGSERPASNGSPVSPGGDHASGSVDPGGAGARSVAGDGAPAPGRTVGSGPGAAAAVAGASALTSSSGSTIAPIRSVRSAAPQNLQAGHSSNTRARQLGQMSTSSLTSTVPRSRSATTKRERASDRSAPVSGPPGRERWRNWSWTTS